MGKCECCKVRGSDVRVSFCPRCKSQNVGYIFGLGNLFGVIPRMRCRDCGFDAVSFPVLIASEEELKKAVGEMKKKAKKKVAHKKKKVVKKVARKKVIRRKRK